MDATDTSRRRHTKLQAKEAGVPTMTDSRAADVLAAHNEWRRGGDGEQTEPATLGLALDRAIARLREPAGVEWLADMSDDDLRDVIYAEPNIAVRLAKALTQQTAHAAPAVVNVGGLKVPADKAATRARATADTLAARHRILQGVVSGKADPLDGEAASLLRAGADALEALAPQPPADLPDWPPQNWAGMDGAIAWHLIDRHADGWQAVGEMMAAWLAANVHQPPAEAQAQVGGRMDQLRKFVEWERDASPGKTHIAEWALYELRRLHVAPPSAPVGVEEIVSEMMTLVADGPSDGRVSLDTVEHWAQRLNEPFGIPEGLPTLAQQPAAVDGAMVELHTNAALAHLSNALDDLDSSPDHRPVALIREAMDRLRELRIAAQSGGSR